MFFILHIFLLLTLIDDNCSISNYECKLLVCKDLTLVCLEDPKCPNDQVFYYYCLQRDITASQRESCEFITQSSFDISKIIHSNPSRTSSWQLGPNTNDYSGIAYYNSDINDRDLPAKTPYGLVNEKKEAYNAQELLRIYDLYKRYSLEENNELLAANKESLPKSISDGLNSDKVKNFNLQTLRKAIELLRKGIQNSKQVNASLVEKKQIIIEKTVHEAGKSVSRLYTKPQGREEVAVAEYFNFNQQKKEIEDKHKKSQNKLVVELSNRIEYKAAVELGEFLQKRLAQIDDNTISLQQVRDNIASYQLIAKRITADTVAEKLNRDQGILTDIQNEIGVRVVRAASSSQNLKKTKLEETNSLLFKGHITIFASVIIVCIVALIIATIGLYLVKGKQKDPSLLAFRKQEAVEDYQELCRTQRSIANVRTDDEDESDKENDKKSYTMKHNWYDEQFPYNMDVSTGHVILSYMEDHLRNENRLNKEWEALCSYLVDDTESAVGAESKNTNKNRYRDVLPYDRTRVKLRDVMNALHSDYINANYITDVDPHNPHYIATQGPLDNTVGDFWQMVWEQNVVVIVNLTKLSDMGLPQCHRYWPENGSEICHIYEVHLISEHIWCDDYLVRSLYLKNLQTGESRTITQFHYLTWADLSIPESPKPLLDFRRKVNKCYRGQGCPVIVHCNNGVGRTGTYILLDMVLNKMIKGTKEIDIAATLEHLRDQRPDMVKTKGQFEFALTATAEEVTAILTAAPK